MVVARKKVKNILYVCMKMVVNGIACDTHRLVIH